ncbi:MAG: ABC transporter permease [Candidatus Thorarchaeota archaeon]
MTAQEVITDADTKQKSAKETQMKWHTRLVSIGSFLLLAFLTLFIIDMFTATLSSWLAFTVSGFDEVLSFLIVSAIRIVGVAALVIMFIMAVQFKSLYSTRLSPILERLFSLGIIIWVTFVFGIGVGFLLTFFVYLWDPLFLEHWSDRRMRLYRLISVGVVIVWLMLEIFLSSEVIGTTIIPATISIPLNNVTGGFSLIATFVVFPVYMLLPRAIEALWEYRRSIESFWIEFIRVRLGVLGMFIIGAIVILALLAPILEWAGLIYGYSELTGSIGENLLLPPSAEHPLGTNHNGHDLLARLVYGTQISLLVGFTASVVAIILGTTVGLVSGYYGGFIDTILMRITDVFLSLPTLPLMLIFLVMFGQGIQNVIVVIAILGWTGTARMVRSEALSLRERPLTEAAHALGAKDSYILLKHILPNTLPLILANMILGVVGAILSEAGIAFLGFVDIHGQPSWGIMLHWANKNAALLNLSWWWIIPPGLLILLTSLGFVFVSHAADKVVNPRLRGRR